MPAPYNHSSGVAGAYDRTPDFPTWARMIFREDRFAQAAELNELQSLAERRGERIARLTIKDGNRVEGADIIVDKVAGSVQLTAGKIYVKGDVLPVAAATKTGVSMNGEVSVGVRLVEAIVDEEDEAALYGLHPGSEAEGEPGAVRQTATISWAISTDGAPGTFYPVYLLRNGTPIDQTPPPAFDGITQQLARYDRDAHGSYVVSGCVVYPLGKTAGKQVFSIGEGVANINGFKRTRYTAMRFEETEAWDTETVDAEPHTFTDGGTGTAVITLNHSPLANLVSAVITKEVTETVTRGPVSGTTDALVNSGVTSVIEVKQGGTTYVVSTDYTVSGDTINWSPGGAEPATGSTYTVKYRYLDAVAPTATTDTTVTLSGGVTGTSVILNYSWKLPRIDALCLDDTGSPVYVKGISHRSNPRAPIIPSELLLLADVHNNWTGAPTVYNTEVRSVPYTEMWRYFWRLFDALDLIALERLKRDIDSREPVAKKGVFVDPFINDYYRDAGVSQTAAVFDGTMQLAIDPTFYTTSMTAPLLLDYTEEIVLRQDLVTRCVPINGYLQFEPNAPTITLNPAVDRWTQQSVQWLSPVTRNQTVRVDARDVRLGREENINATTAQNVTGAITTEDAEFLREITVAFTIKDFKSGEALTSLKFDGIDVTPAGPLTANGSGEITGTFDIPANVPAGSRLVEAAGNQQSKCAATFVGSGTITVREMQRVTTRRRTIVDPRDPLAQTFSLPEGRFISGVNLRFCAKGNVAKKVIVRIGETDNGYPSADIIAEATVDMATVVLDTWTSIRWPSPVYLSPDRQYAISVLTEDSVHAISAAKIGEYDATAQRTVTQQPYTVGVMFDSSNAMAWTARQDEDLAFQLLGCVFNPTTKSVNLGSYAVTQMSDVLVRATVELPTEDARFYFEVERAGGEITRLLPNQPWQLTEYVTETVILRAVLNGTSKISPVLYPGALMIAGKIRATGTYVCRAFDLGTSIRLSNYMKLWLPAGSGITVEFDAADGNWLSTTLQSTTALNDGWLEREYRKTAWTATQGRIRVTLSGTPAARPRIEDFRAVVI